MLGLDPITLLINAICLLIALPIHEFAHAWTADRFGDDTPRYYGRLTLNPLAHLDPIGSLMMIVVGFGWAKPVPVDVYRLQRHSPAALMWVSLAGPVSNFLQAVFGAVIFRLGYATGLITFPLTSFPEQLLTSYIFINIALMLFNMIPLAPLDGDKIAEYFFPPPFANALNALRPFAPLILMALFVLGRIGGTSIFGLILYEPATNIARLLLGL